LVPLCAQIIEAFALWVRGCHTWPHKKRNLELPGTPSHDRDWFSCMWTGSTCIILLISLWDSFIKVPSVQDLVKSYVPLAFPSITIVAFLERWAFPSTFADLCPTLWLWVVKAAPEVVKAAAVARRLAMQSNFILLFTYRMWCLSESCCSCSSVVREATVLLPDPKPKNTHACVVLQPRLGYVNRWGICTRIL
jgi:hypothetical protein